MKNKLQKSGMVAGVLAPFDPTGFSGVYSTGTTVVWACKKCKKAYHTLKDKLHHMKCHDPNCWKC